MLTHAGVSNNYEAATAALADGDSGIYDASTSAFPGAVTATDEYDRVRQSEMLTGDGAAVYDVVGSKL